MDSTFRPELARARIADSRPEPAPRTRTSTSLRPWRMAFWAACSAARWAAKGVLLRVPLKPTMPAEPELIASPDPLVIVTCVLLNEALMCTNPRATDFLSLRLTVFDMAYFIPFTDF